MPACGHVGRGSPDPPPSPREVVMRFIQVQGGSVRTGSHKAFQEWVEANEQKLAAAYPEGTSLLGIYAAVFSSEKEAGSYFTLEQVDSYAALDKLAALAKDPNSELGKLIRKFVSFLDL